MLNIITTHGFYSIFNLYSESNSSDLHTELV